MKLKNLFLMALAASTSFASCDSGSEEAFVNNNNATNENNGMKSVTVTIANQKNVMPGSRAVVQGDDDDTNGSLTGNDVEVANAKDLVALFADSEGKIVEVRKLSDALNEEDADNTVAKGNVYTFHRLTGDATQVAITNLNNSAISTIKDLEGDDVLTQIKNANINLSTVSSALNTLETQNKTGKLNEILVYGVSTKFTPQGNQEHEGVNYGYYKAEDITVNPAVARLEITGFKCTDLNENNAYTDEPQKGLHPRYKEVYISAIGINNTYFETIGTTFLTDEEVDSGGTEGTWGAIAMDETYKTKETEGGLFNYYKGEEVFKGQTNWTKDSFTITKNEDNTSNYDNCIKLTNINDASEKVIAFNVAPGNIPQIIVQVGGGVKSDHADDANLIFPYYVKTKMDGGLSGTDLTEEGFKAGYIYQVKFEFKCRNVCPWTPSDNICVDVKVEIPNWFIVSELKPEFK